MEEENEVKEVDDAVEETPKIDVELEKLRIENEQLRNQLAKTELERDEAQRVFLHTGKEVKPQRDLNTILGDIQ